MPLSESIVRDALRTVQDPDLGKDLVTLNMIKRIEIDGDHVLVGVELTTPACPMKDKIKGDVVAAVQQAAEAEGQPLSAVEVDFTADVRGPNEKLREEPSPLPLVKHVIAVGAGKGGVGKSTIAALLALGLARHGARVGLLDGDIYGPSMPTMLGLDSVPGKVDGNMLLPFEVHGIKAMTIGKLVEPDKALVWRGPMAHGAFKQLAVQTDWGALDYLIVDLPPGTGDVPLTLAQLLPLSGAVVVCTPQKVAQDDARRAIRMFRQLGIDVLGVVENMSHFIAPDGTEHDLFGRGGAEMLAQGMNVPYVGALPIRTAIREHLDAGTPSAIFDDEDAAGEIDALVKQFASQVSIATMGGRAVQPTLSIS